MAELIKRDELVEKIWERHDYISKHPEDYDNTDEVQDELCGIVAVADELPTTTEAEIRAKAYEEFKELAFTMFTDFDMAHGYPTLGDVETILYDVAEQLKEE